MQKYQITFLLLFSLCFFSVNYPTFANNQQIIENFVYYDNDTNAYISKFTLLINAPKSCVKEIFLDYDNLPSIQKNIIKVKIIKKDKNYHQVKTVTKDCILFFCKKVTNMQIITFPEEFIIISNTLPEYSNIKVGSIKWKIDSKLSSENQSIVKIDTKFIFDFYIPAFIRDKIIMKKMAENIEQAIVNIENKCRQE